VQYFLARFPSSSGLLRSQPKLFFFSFPRITGIEFYNIKVPRSPLFLFSFFLPFFASPHSSLLMPTPTPTSDHPLFGVLLRSFFFFFPVFLNNKPKSSSSLAEFRFFFPILSFFLVFFGHLLVDPHVSWP